VRRGAISQQHRTGLGTCLDLVPVGGDDEIGSRMEVAVDGADADAGLGCDVADGHIDARGDESRRGRIEQRILVWPGVDPASAAPATQIRLRCRPLLQALLVRGYRIS
jgi:hypothetical protein